MADTDNTDLSLVLRFGSFVDKELLPYISLKPGENCQQKGGKCPPPYR